LKVLVDEAWLHADHNSLYMVMPLLVSATHSLGDTDAGLTERQRAIYKGQKGGAGKTYYGLPEAGSYSSSTTLT